MVGPASEMSGAGRRLTAAVVAALLLEIMLVAATAWWITAGLHPIARPKGLPRIELSLTAPKPLVAPPAPKPPRPHPRPVVHKIPKPPPSHHARPRPRPQPTPLPKPARHRTIHRVRAHPVSKPPPVTAAPSPKAVSVPKKTAPPMAVRRHTPVGNPLALAAWEGRVKAAIQDALVYPSSARWLGESGRVQVSFEWTRGVILRPRILTSSGIPALDRAALTAVHTAEIPSPPGNIGTGPFRFAVWVQFSLSEGS